MASRKKTPARARPRASTKSPARAAPAKRPSESVAVKVLGRLPAIDSKLRAAFRSTFSDEQCAAWGSKTRAADVLRESAAWVTALHATLGKQPVAGYSARRLGYLCELLVELEDELAVSTSPAEQHAEHQGARSSALVLAIRTRDDLEDRLTLVAGGRADLLAALSERRQVGKSLPTVRDTLAGLIDLAGRWRKDPVLELLAEDADLTAARLNAAYNALESLSRTDEVLREAPAAGADAASVDLVEGRVLHELHLAQQAFARARQAGQTVPALAPGPALRKAFKPDAPAGE